ncbi:MAG: S46 family peptidase [Sphingobacteriales bacterium]|nr:S46 family peptidase [Sphingobacteriales bacterium]
MKSFFLSLGIFILFSVKVKADEGMWLPQLLQSLNEKEMKRMGMKISAADIYSISKSSLKDAIVSFGGFCTAEVISDKGLLLTNHHCGFDAIQNHSSLTDNYIQKGFWAKNYGQELPNQSLFATFIVRIEEVTNTVLAGLPANISEKERQSLIDKNIAQLRKDYKKETYEDLIIRPFFDGNKYYLFVTETYRDVRLVGAPPSSIGNFGKDTDNWMWPRHTGDFSMFRIYAGKDNKPAAYSPENVPYTPKRSLKISLKGLKEGDFTMVFGFPGRTNEYLTAAAVKQVMTVNDPAKIKIRHQALDVLNRYMRSDEKIRIQYAAKYASVENAYKKWQGEVLGLTRSGAVDKKLAYEMEFTKRVNANPQWKAAYSDLLPKLNEAYAMIEPYAYARDYYNEVMPRIELMGIAADMNSLVIAYAKDEASYLKRKEEIRIKLEETYKEYNMQVDRSLFESLIALYSVDQPGNYVSPILKQSLTNQQQTYLAVAADLYAKTSFAYPDSMYALLAKTPAETIEAIGADPAYQLYLDMNKTYTTNVSPKLNEWQSNINQWQRSYMKAQLEVFPEKKFYPDANGTLRVTYGNVKPYQPSNGVSYHYYTYMEGIMEKYKPGDYEFDVPQKLIDLYKTKDFGRYGVNGKQPVCFIAANHTTGGNSGSPALDAYGNLVGLNFDRVWEGTMSDLNYDASICRNIMVDIRYILFIVDKFAGATNLIAEMNISSGK